MGIAGENVVIVEGDAVGFAQQITAGIHELSADAIGGRRRHTDGTGSVSAAPGRSGRV